MLTVSSLIDTPPLYLYCAGKAGILGLMRGLRLSPPCNNMSVNMVAPWMTGPYLPLPHTPSRAVVIQLMPRLLRLTDVL